ncbi:MAG: ATP synthase F1 subunit epsilon [Culicoidibacterales bacterium]
MEKQDELILRVVTPYGVVYDGPIESVVVNGRHGKFGLKKNHLPIVARLSIGDLQARFTDNSIHYFAVAGGILEMSDNIIKLLTLDAIDAANVDTLIEKQRVEDLKREKRMQQSRSELMSLDIELQKAINRLNVADVMKKIGR